MVRFSRVLLLLIMSTALLVACDFVNMDATDDNVSSSDIRDNDFTLTDIISKEGITQIVGSSDDNENSSDEGITTTVNPIDVGNVSGLSSNGHMDGTDLGRTNSSNTLGVDEVEDLLWNFNSNNEITSTPIKAADNSGVLFGDISGTFYSLEINTGDINWEFSANGPITTTAAVTDRLVAFGSRDQYLYVVDLENGDLVWKFNAGGWIESSPVIDDGVIYFGSYNGMLYALDIESGEIIWEFDAKSVIASAPSINAAILYFLADDGVLWAIDRYTGRAKWNFAMYSSTPVLSEVVTESSAPIFLLDTIYVSGLGGIVYAIDGKTGQEKWKFKIDTLLSLNLSASDGIIYMVELAGTVVAVDAKSGNSIWELPDLSAYNDPVFVTGDIVYFGTTAGDDDRGTIHAVESRTGRPKWEFKVLSSVNTYPSVYDGVLYVGSGDGHVYALKGSSGDTNPIFNNK